jgi:GNAT superfamily N-acetyltransferase
MTAEPTSNEIVIREARSDEMSLVRELFLEYASSLGFDLGFQNFDEELATLPGKYARPDGRILLAFWSGVLAGCVALRAFDERRCEMKRLYVRPAYRGHRLGDALIDRFMQDARESGHYESVLLDTIQPLMSRAIILYKKMGFFEIPAYRSNPIDGAVYLECKL